MTKLPQLEIDGFWQSRFSVEPVKAKGLCQIPGCKYTAKWRLMGVWSGKVHLVCDACYRQIKFAAIKLDMKRQRKGK